MALSDRIESAMRLAGVDQSELARRLRITPAAVNQWISGRTKPNAARLEQIVEVLRVPADAILSDAGDAPLLDDTEPLASAEGARLSDEAVQNAGEAAAITFWRMLSDDEQRAVLAYIRQLLRSRSTRRTTDHPALPKVNEP